MVVDYRKLNQQTIPENFPMQNITDSLQALGPSHPTIFSTLEMQSGYHQIPIKNMLENILGPLHQIMSINLNVPRSASVTVHLFSVN
jgi:hypothetical protein